MDKHRVPQHLDAPFKVMLWTLDELCALGAPFLVCIFCLDAPIVGLAVGAALLALLKKAKGEQGHYFLRCLLYWHFPQLFAFKKTPPSHVREWVG